MARAGQRRQRTPRFQQAEANLLLAYLDHARMKEEWPMALTDHSALYGAIRESGINRVARLAMQQRPSLFNYATAAIIAKPQLLPRPISANAQVQKSGNPLISPLPPLPIIGSGGFGLDYCVQVAIAQIDCAPGQVITLPPGLAPLPAQRLAVQAEVVGGVACPSAETLAGILAHLPPPSSSGIDTSNLTVKTVIPTTKLITFQVDAYVVLGASVSGQPPHEVADVAFGGLKLTGLLADQIEAIVECYVNLVMQLTVIPRLKLLVPTTIHYALKPISPDVSLPLALNGALTPTPARVPHNPAIEEDQIKVYADLQVVHA